MKRTILLLSLLVAGTLLTAGCTGTPATNNSTHTPAASPPTTLSNVTIPEANTSTAITIPAGTTTTIELRENPTTGYAWNVTLSSGLTIENTTYIQGNGTADRVGAGGMHQWVVRAVSPGNQTFSAIYKRPWEPTTGNETHFTQVINVI